MAAPVAASTQTWDLHSFLEQYERDYPDEVVHIEQPIAAAWEVTSLITKLEKAKRFPVVVCHNVLIDGQRAELPLVTFLMASRLRLARALGTDVRTVGLAVYEGVQRREKPVVVSREEAPVKQMVQRGAEIDLRRFPAPVHHSMDPGPYITEGLVLTYNRESHRDNSAMQRGWIAGRDEVRVYLGRHSHNWHNFLEYERAGEDMPAAFWVGHHPLVLLGAETHVGPDDSHYETAGGLIGAPLRLVPSETLGEDFLVPADAEVVIEGYIPCGQRKPEGPFGEYSGYVGPQRWNPVLKVTAVTRRRDAYWDDVMEGHTHWSSALMREGVVFRDVRRVVPGVRAVHVPISGIVHAYVQIHKTVEGQGKTAAVAALTSIQGNKHAFVFDEDVDIFDEKEALRALAWRFQGDRDFVMLQGVDGTFLDPSLPDDRTTTKVGFDCTKPLGQPFAERLAVPDDVMARIDPVEVLGREQFDRIPVEPWG
jgi:2,5-furandicarboxylate decarboxylase 1